MKINKKELQTALETVKPGLATQEVIEQSTSFAFMKDKVVTYNEEISISHPVKDLNLTGAVKAEELYKLLSKITKDEVSFEVGEDKIILKSGRAKAEFILQSEIILPLEDVGEIKNWKPLPDDFLKNLKFTVPCVGKDSTRPILNSVHVTEKGIVEASDGYRITQCKGSEIPVGEFLLGASAVVNVIQFQPIDIAEGEGWVHFQNKNGAVLSCRVFEDNYVNTDSFIQQADKGVEVKFPEEMIEALERARVFSKRDHYLEELISVSIGEKIVKLQSESDGGKFEEKIKIDYQGDPIDFSITPYIFQDILKETQTAKIQKDKVSFIGEDWVYLGMLRA